MGMDPSFSLSNDETNKVSRLPLGYRFDPTDVELLEYYLITKLKGEELPSNYVIDLDVYQYEPSQLPLNQFKHATQNEGYFFTVDLRKYSREVEGLARATPNGYWKVYKKNVPIYLANEIIGFKTKLSFHNPEGNKTDWKMIEYRCHYDRIPPSTSSMKVYMVCKVRQKMKMEEDCLVEELSEEESGFNEGSHRPKTM